MLSTRDEYDRGEKVVVLVVSIGDDVVVMLLCELFIPTLRGRGTRTAEETNHQGTTPQCRTTVISITSEEYNTTRVRRNSVAG